MRSIQSEQLNYLSVNTISKANGLTLSEKKGIDQALTKLSDTEEKELQLEIPYATLERLLANQHIHIADIRCLNKQSKEQVSKCLLRNCHFLNE